MGHDCSYSQPSESEEYGGETADSSYSETEDLIRRDRAEISYNYGASSQYPPQPEVEFGFPQTCYCGSQPVLATSYTRNDLNLLFGKLVNGEQRWAITNMSNPEEIFRYCKRPSNSIPLAGYLST
ncbi:hypothetical protein Bca52824_062797 [Brassica carinata]|uniref:Uncharacterized protein n=1 Tax=Brassica carinata TaxID=52824 RepID=A0A8X7QF97_BRACI|nr:hypothetical protein Bca52824_062797 [Brassica carinata]